MPRDRQSDLDADAELTATSGWDTQREAQIHATMEAARRVEQKKAAARRRLEAGEPEPSPEERQAERKAERARRRKEAAQERILQGVPRDQPSTRAAAAPAAAAGAPRAAAGEKASKAADKENRETAATDEVTKAEKVEASRKASGGSFAAALATATGAELPPPTTGLDADDAAAAALTKLIEEQERGPQTAAGDGEGTTTAAGAGAARCSDPEEQAAFVAQAARHASTASAQDAQLARQLTRLQHEGGEATRTRHLDMEQGLPLPRSMVQCTAAADRRQFTAAGGLRLRQVRGAPSIGTRSPPLHLASISPRSRLDLASISPRSPLYLPCISRGSRCARARRSGSPCASWRRAPRP